MEKRLFADQAPRHWLRKLSVIPIEPASKQPARGLKNWTAYCDNLPKPETRTDWLERYPDHGIGLCLGTRISETHRIGVVDVDDDAYVRVVLAVLGGSVAAKRGKKGLSIFVRVTV